MSIMSIMSGRQDWKSAQAVVPVAQAFKRSISMGRSPAQEIAGSIARHLKLPVFNPFVELSPAYGPRQAERRGEQRYQLDLSEKFKTEKIPPHLREIILVDDFMTTGHTLRESAKILHEAGLKNIHAFVLGIRPLRDNEFNSQSLKESSHLPHGGSRTVSIGEKSNALELLEHGRL